MQDPKRKLYTGPLVDVSFDSDLCIHSGNCVRSMPEIFNVKARPWVNPSVADTAQKADFLRNVVSTCPRHALRIEEHPA
ncbi:(4Fe-4S)-binding protein [Arcanobacterium hippocoleae]